MNIEIQRIRKKRKKSYRCNFKGCTKSGKILVYCSKKQKDRWYCDKHYDKKSKSDTICAICQKFCFQSKSSRILMIKEEILDLVGEFTYCWGWHFFVETSMGNFHWKDPDYNGDNSFVPFCGTYTQFCKDVGVPYGRDKGKHVIREYCGTNIQIKDICP